MNPIARYLPGIDEYVSLQDVPAARRLFLVGTGLLLIASDFLPNVGLDAQPWSLGIELVLGVGALVIALADRLDAERRTEWRNRMVAVAISVVLAGAAAEAATRWVFRDVTTSADSGAFFSRDWARGNIVLNEYGFRERSFATVKPTGIYRIAVIGDSFTFGNGLLPAERYSDRLDAWLPDRFEVLNFGTPGDNTPHHLDALRASVLQTHPDFVLLQWFVNDIEGNDLTRRPVASNLVPFTSIHRWLNGHSAFYAVGNLRWRELQVALGVSPNFTDYLRTRAGDAGSDDARREAATLRRIIETSRLAGAEVGIVLFPDAGYDLGAAYPFAFLHERTLAVCREMAVPCLDLRESFAKLHNRRSLWVSPFDHHPSARANDIAAADILRVFQPFWAH